MSKVILRYKPLKDGKFSIYIDYTVNGIRKYEFLKLRVSKDYSKSRGVTETDKAALELAETIRAKRQNELYHNKGFDTEVKRVNRYLFDYIEESYNLTKRQSYRYLLVHLKNFTKKSPLLGEVNPQFINRFMAYLKTIVSSNSVKYYCSTLGIFINKAIKENILSENPFTRVKMPSYITPDRTYLTEEELKRLFENRCLNNEQTEQAFLFSCFTGLRFSDVKALKTNDIHKEKNNGKISEYILIRPFKTRKTTGRLLKIPLSEQVLRIIKEVKRSNASEFLFDNLPDKSAVNRALKVWAKHAKINKRLHFHVARHTFAVMGLCAGISIYSVSKLLGHSSVMTTQIYAALTDEKKLKETDKFPVFSL